MLVSFKGIPHVERVKDRYLCVIYIIVYFYQFNRCNKKKYIFLRYTFVPLSTEETDLQMRIRSVLANCTEDLQTYMLASKQLVESELKNLLTNVSDVNLHPLLEYALLTKGKRLRPILTLMSAESVGGNPKSVMQLALSFELLHTATLVHDDIIDQDASRRGAKTLFSKWSANNAILAGDALIALSVSLAADFGPRIMKILANVGLELCDGEYIDTALSLEQATEHEYFIKIEKKSASLFRGAAYCGGLAASGEHLEVEALADFGKFFGMAYQLNDDLGDVLGQDQISQDLKNGNVTLPFLYAYEHGNKAMRQLLKENSGNKDITALVAKEIRERMEETGAFRYCRRRISEYTKKSQMSLSVIRESVFKSCLMQFPACIDVPEG